MITIDHITDTLQNIDNMKAVIFDLDDTLYSEKEYVRSGYRAVAQMLPEIAECDRKLWKAFQEDQSAIDEVLKSENIYTEELKQKCLQTYRFHQPGIHLYGGVAEMLMELRNSGYQLGIITDGRPEGQRAKIKALGLEDYIDTDKIIITDELGGVTFRKPNDTAFRMMKEKLKVDFSEMCYVGDNIGKDFIAPQQLGMRCIWFRNKDGLY